MEEVKLWNTPAIGAYLLWEFTKGYCEGHPNKDAPFALLHFVAAAILTNTKLLEPISNKRDNLQSYVRDFEHSKNSDLLLNIQERTKEKYRYTIASIDIAINKGLLVWDPDTAKLYPRDIPPPRIKRVLQGKLDKDGKKAYILGKWFSQHNLFTIASYLKVVF